MICRASSGQTLPALARVRPPAPVFPGSACAPAILRCMKLETDPLVDRESCRAWHSLHDRSARRWAIAVIGLLEVFSTQKPMPSAPMTRLC